jgi:hypothetical protein
VGRQGIEDFERPDQRLGAPFEPALARQLAESGKRKLMLA